MGNNTTLSSNGGLKNQNLINGNQKLKENEYNNNSYNDDTRNENGITNDDNRNANQKSDSENDNQQDQKKKHQSDFSPQKSQGNGQNQSDNNPPLKYTFTVNGKSMKQLEEEKFNEQEEDNFSDILLSTDIREGGTPQMEDDYLDDEEKDFVNVYEKNDISLADIGDGLMFDGNNAGLGMSRKMTLKKAATLKKAETLKKKVEIKQIIQTFEIQPSKDYFMPDFFKQFTKQATNKKDYLSTNTLFVPQPQ